MTWGKRKDGQAYHKGSKKGMKSSNTSPVADIHLKEKSRESNDIDNFEYQGVVAEYDSPSSFYYEEFETLPQEWIQIMESDGFKLTKKTEDFLWQRNSGGWTTWDKSDYVKDAYMLSQKDRDAITNYWKFKRAEERGTPELEKLNLEDYQKKQMAEFLMVPENKSQFDALMKGLAKEGIVPPLKKNEYFKEKEKSPPRLWGCGHMVSVEDLDAHIRDEHYPKSMLKKK